MVYTNGGAYDGVFIKGAKQGKGVFEDLALVYTEEWKNNGLRIEFKLYSQEYDLKQ
jgi:hypothetical protein